MFQLWRNMVGDTTEATAMSQTCEGKKNIVSVLTETIDASRDFLTRVFKNKKLKFFRLRADTGVGKNEAAITFFLRGLSGLLTVPTTDLAKE